MSTRTLIAVLTAAAALGFTVSAQAADLAPATEQVSVRVSVADLDLRKDAGAAVARLRIHAAARTACGNESQSAGLDRYIPYLACVRSSVDDALVSLDARIMAAQTAPSFDRRPILLSRR